MLSFAAPQPPVQARGTVVSEHTRSGLGGLPARPGASSARPLTALPSHSTYWPCELLNAFVLQMACAGHCVNTDMMLGHRGYAQEQLALAKDSSDAELSALAQRLQAYFDAAAPDGCKVAAALRRSAACTGLLLV